MTTQNGSTSPRWDSRNQGFISPAQLQQWKQQQQQQQQRPSHEFPPSPPPERPSQDEPRPHAVLVKRSSVTPGMSNGQTSPSHSRGLSGAFSLFRTRTSNQDDQPAPPPKTGEHNNGAAPLSPSSGSMSSLRSPASPPLDLGASAPQPPVNPHVLRRFSTNTSEPPLHPEIRSIVQLTVAHGNKIYFSGPLVKRVERQPDGQRPTRDDGWRDVWAQLNGTSMSIWDMNAIDEASKQGKQVPPTYINITDAFVNVLGSVTVPATASSPSVRYSNVLTLTTAGSNLLLFSCPSPEALISWAAALRLAAWEKSRLEEIYTAHLIRITLNDGRDHPSPLVHGRLEGWVRIRIAGQVDWKRMWMVVLAGGHAQDGSSVSSVDHPNRPGSPTTSRRKRMSNLFSRERSPQRPSSSSKPMLQLLASSKPKDRKKPLLTMHSISQAFAVYPERPDLISCSTLMKLEGQLGDEEVAGAMKAKECWLMILPEFDGPNIKASEMLKWLVAIHDAFEMYGRPKMYSWDPRDPRSMMFAYPIGPQRDMLFFDRELAEGLDVREDRTSAIRGHLQNILTDRMRGVVPTVSSSSQDRPPVLPPLPDVSSDDLHADAAKQQTEIPSSPLANQQEPLVQEPPMPHEPLSMQLPAFSFESNAPEPEPPAVPEKRALTPITEQSRDENGPPSTPAVQQQRSPPTKIVEVKSGASAPVLGQSLVTSPTTASPPPQAESLTRRSEELQEAPVVSAEPKRFSRPEVSRATSNGALAGRDPSAAPQPPTKLLPTSPTSPEPTSRPMMSAHISAVSTSAPTTTKSSAAANTASPRPTSPNTQPTSSAPSLTSSMPPFRPELKSKPSAPVQSISPVIASSSGSSSLPPPPPPHSDGDLSQAAGALYYMRQMEQEDSTVSRVRNGGQPPPPISKLDDEESLSEDSHAYTPPPRINTSPLNVRYSSPPRPPPSTTGERPSPTRRDTNLSVASARSNLSGTDPAMAASASRSGVARKPSGARAPASSNLKSPTISRNSFTPERSLLERNDEDEDEDDFDEQEDPPERVRRAMNSLEDPNADALAALSFLEQGESGEPSPSRARATTQQTASPPPAVSAAVEPAARTNSSDSRQEYRSSFAPSRQAAERKAKMQAQQAAQQAAVSRPGRANGKAKVGPHAGWMDSSDEEEEDEEEDDDDADSDVELPPRMAAAAGQMSRSSSAAPSQAGSNPYAAPSNAASARSLSTGVYQQPRPRPPRELPQLPAQNYPMGNQDDYLSPQPRRLVSENFSNRLPDAIPPRNTPSVGSNLRPQSEYPVPPAANRQTIWSQALGPGHSQGFSPPPPNGPVRDTFVQIEQPSQAMTKAFTPHGLLSAGLQDREDRSAKRQEEIARETGASLINVPGKPPPPQTGLLGAVTAHERERKREGGLGAILTEREREKRMAEDRQRKLDQFQRQQLDQMQQAGGMYGMGMPGFNSMMANPMMMGVNPMMTGGWGYPGMMPGFSNPQHMMAAQQAAMQAYQQAMMAFSASGSHMGGDTGPAPLNPMMTGGSMGMGAMDPRMSMMGMPMMSPSMGMNPAVSMSPSMGMGMAPGMGMNPAMSPGMGMGMGMNPMATGMGMGNMSPMGMQMTGNFDTRSSPSGFDNGGQQPPTDGPRYSAQNSSGGRGTPAPPNTDQARGRPDASSPLR